MFTFHPWVVYFRQREMFRSMYLSFFFAFIDFAFTLLWLKGIFNSFDFLERMSLNSFPYSRDRSRQHWEQTESKGTLFVMFLLDDYEDRRWIESRNKSSLGDKESNSIFKLLCQKQRETQLFYYDCQEEVLLHCLFLCLLWILGVWSVGQSNLSSVDTELQLGWKCLSRHVIICLVLTFWGTFVCCSWVVMPKQFVQTERTQGIQHTKASLKEFSLKGSLGPLQYNITRDYPCYASGLGITGCIYILQTFCFSWDTRIIQIIHYARIYLQFCRSTERKQIMNAKCVFVNEQQELTEGNASHRIDSGSHNQESNTLRVIVPFPRCRRSMSSFSKLLLSVTHIDSLQFHHFSGSCYSSSAHWSLISDHHHRDETTHEIERVYTFLILSSLLW